MSPSKLVRRAGIVSGIATGTFMIAMAASPAYAIGTPTLAVGSLCPPPSLASLIPDGLECVNGVLVTITSQLPVPTAAPTTKAAASPSPSPSPNPLTGLVGGVTGTVTKTVTGVTGGVTGLLGGGSSTLPGTPGTPSGAPTSSGAGGTGTGTTAGGGTTTTSGTSTTGTGSTPKPSGISDGSTALGPAAAFLPGLGISDFTDLSSVPLADSIPLPQLAAPDTKLAAVQAPLIAAGEQAAKAADTSSPFSRFVGNKALSGLLIIIATALVAAVGAGNIRAWQARLAAKRQS
jgi:hypothetical protein